MALLLRSTTLKMNSFSLLGVGFSAVRAADARSSKAANENTSDFFKYMNRASSIAACNIDEQEKRYTAQLYVVKKTT